MLPSVVPALLLLVVAVQAGMAQEDKGDDLPALAARLSAMTAVSGFEQAMADTLIQLLSPAKRDRAGNVVVRLGRGEPKRLAVCALDEPGYVVSGIRDDGYLTLRRVGPAPGPLFDQQLEGHRVTLFGTKGAVPGVVGVRSVHLTRGRPLRDDPFVLDNGYVDVGADSRDQVLRSGIRLLTPVALAKRPHHYGERLLAAPVAARRTACAALLTAARSARPHGTVIIAFAVEDSFHRRGLLTLVNLLGPFEETVLLSMDSLPMTESRLGSVARWELQAKYTDTPVETVSLTEAEQLRDRISRWIGGTQ